MKRVAMVIGTRPEAIKLAPVVKALRLGGEIDVRIIATAQHRDLLDQALAEVGIVPDVDLDLMTAAQSLSAFSGRCLLALGEAFARERPDYVIGQGDTSTVHCAALAAWHARIPFGHVEAGLRSGASHTPFPEEQNRRLVSLLAAHHFCPTEMARANLLREGIEDRAIHVTGNTVIDTLVALTAEMPATLRDTPPTLLVTVHRSENVAAVPAIAGAVLSLLDRFPELHVRWPVHPNPRIEGAVRGALVSHPRLALTDALPYRAFVRAMRDATLILTDSGGVQEEAPTLGTPVLILREETERPECILAGVARLVGNHPGTILSAASELIGSEHARTRMTGAGSPYGDGRAGERIAEIVARHLADAVAHPPPHPLGAPLS